MNYNCQSLSELARQAIKTSEYWTSKSRVSSTTFQGITCPVCMVPAAAWAYADHPFVLICNRLSKCGARTNTIELFNLRQDIEKEFKATKADPNRPARIYLQSRGLKNSLKSLVYSYWPNVRKTGRGAVMFPVAKLKNGKTVYNGRLIYPPTKEKKTHNSGSTSGLFWQHPGLEYNPRKETYIVEGILDALSLIELGYQAIAVLASGQDPAKLDGLSFFKKITLAFDPDLAGARATKKFKAQFPDADAIMPDSGDWNDLLCSGPQEKVKEQFRQNLNRYRVNAALSLSTTGREYAEIFFAFHHRAPGIFEHSGSTFFSYLKKKRDENPLIVESCGNFLIEALSFRKDTSTPERPEFFYHLRVLPKSGRPVDTIATGRNLATPRGLREFFLTRAKVSFEGGTMASTALASLITSSKVPEVQQISQTGFDENSAWYFFKNFAIDKKGMIQRPKRGLYKLNFREWAAPSAHAGEKSINPAETGLPVSDIHKLITTAWGPRGSAALAWVVSSWFTVQIKRKLGFFPFFSFWGDVQAAKSSLVVLLNQMQGFDTEGCSTSSLNTRKGLVRNIGRVSNLFTAIIEGNIRDERSSFDYSTLLPLYNRNPLQLMAKFSNNFQTVETPFSGALLFAANNEVFKGKAEKERTVSLEFKTEHLNNTTKAAYDQLTGIPQPVLARVIMVTLSYRQVFIENWFSEFQKASKELESVKNRRIRENHALILAFHRLFCRVHKTKNSRQKTFIEEIALRKEITAAQTEHTIADDFFEKVDLIADDKLSGGLYLNEKTGKLYLYMAKVEQELRHNGFQFTANARLFEALRNHPGYVKASHVFRFPNDPDIDEVSGRPKTRRVWVFDMKKMK